MADRVPDCPFCNVDSSTVTLWNEHCLFIQDPAHQQVLKHSGIIIPKAHRETVFDLSPEEIANTFELLAEARAYLDRACQPDGFTIGWSCFPVGGQTIMHAHLHVIPRFADEPYAGRGLRWWLKQSSNLRPS
ncbi:MAG: HIT domain-containing protein [Myxococcota bacterium]